VPMEGFFEGREPVPALGRLPEGSCAVPVPFEGRVPAEGRCEPPDDTRPPLGRDPPRILRYRRQKNRMTRNHLLRERNWKNCRPGRNLKSFPRQGCYRSSPPNSCRPGNNCLLRSCRANSCCRAHSFPRKSPRRPAKSCHHHHHVLHRPRLDRRRAHRLAQMRGYSRG
jgi:hypothetical protein